MIFIFFSPALVSRTSFFDTRILFHTIPAGRQINYITYLVALSCQMIHSICAASPLLPSFFSSIRGQVRGRGLSLTPQGLSASAPSLVPPLSLSLSLSFHQNKLHDARSFKNNQPSHPPSLARSLARSVSHLGEGLTRRAQIASSHASRSSILSQVVALGGLLHSGKMLMIYGYFSWLWTVATL